MCGIEPLPVIETRRLALRAPRPEDAPRLVALANDPDIARMTLRMPSPYSAAHAEEMVIGLSQMT